MIHEYKTGRSVCGFIEFCAWAGVVVSAIMILAALGTSTRGGGYQFALAGIVPALLLLIFSFVLVVMVQMARATMDGSVAAQKGVVQGNKQHDELLQALRSYAARASTTDARGAVDNLSLGDANSMETSATAANEPQTVAAPAPVDIKGFGGRLGMPVGEAGLHDMKQDPKTKQLYHREELILDNPRGVYAVSRRFDTLDDARSYIDQKEALRLADDASSKTVSDVVEYRGQKIRHENGKYGVDDTAFASLESAKYHVDRMASDHQAGGRREPVLRTPDGLS